MSTYIDKLDYTEETKNLIKEAIVKKGVAVAPEDTFRSYATKIEEIQAGGPTLPEYDGPVTVDPTISVQTLATQDKTVKSNITVNAVTSSIDANIQAENIKKDVSILGVTGTLEAGGGGGGASGLPSMTLHDTWQNGNLTKQIKSVDWTEFNKLGITNLSNFLNGFQGNPCLETMDFSHITSFKELFAKAECTINLTNAVFTAASGTENMFGSCKSPEIIFNNTDLSTVGDFWKTFYSCTTPVVDMSGMITSNNAKEWSSTFGYASCTKIILPETIIGFDSGNIFSDCSSLKEVDMSKATIDPKINRTDGWFGKWSYCNALTSVKFPQNMHPGRNTKSFDVSNAPNLDKASALDLLNKLVPVEAGSGYGVIFSSATYGLLTPDEIKIGTDKNYTVGA